MGTFSITPTVAEGMLNSTGFAEALGASPTLRIYAGTPPANAAAALSSNTLLATLACAATPISGWTDTGTAGRATYAAIASATAAATGTATFFRHLKSDGTTVLDQGAVGTSGADCNLNTTAITSGSTVSITSDTMDLPYGP
jgi:hypothetical protein